MNQPMDSEPQRILQTIHSIPEGSVATYGQIAKLAGLPGKARYVGYILKTLPQGSTIPWHRVINSKQRISFNEGSDAYLRQKSRLEDEGWEISGQRLIQKEAH